MNPRLRRPRASRRAVAGAAAVLGVALLSACGDGGDSEKSPTTTPGSSVVTTPTNKGKPGGPNNFTPTPIAPLTPTGGQAPNGTAQH